MSKFMLYYQFLIVNNVDITYKCLKNAYLLRIIFTQKVVKIFINVIKSMINM